MGNATGRFSTGAQEEAQRPDTVPVSLVDGEELVGLLMQYGIGVRKTALELFALGEADDAPPRPTG